MILVILIISISSSGYKAFSLQAVTFYLLNLLFFMTNFT